ncbi:hypothetical protein CDV31_000004 [Fusarium ambrosium]|uniref:Uncharacterized protein n=1 Tax=Fusarium ambrosium TaxID=131363 RepID=A0A428V369_9HYPO|nr:hypothetical protein CDV31_000004 [Fusarium ambrosium]
MEAIGVGANVLAFVVLGIKSAKMAHETLSAIKDGPALVQSVAANFLQLHWILEQLLQCRAAATDPALHGQARQCCEDLDKLAKTIERLQVPPREKATGKFWKRLKAAINENDLKRLDAWAGQQASMLSLRLNVLSSNVLYATRDGNERIQQQIHSFGTSMQTQFESQTASFLNAARNMTSSHADGRSALEAGLSSIQETIEATHSISSEDTRSMFQLLQEIKDRVAPESTGGTESTKVKCDHEQTMGGTAPSLNHKMLESINSLCGLIDEKRDAIDVYAEDDDQAESVIEDLQTLVKSLRGQKLPVSDQESFEKDLRRFGRSFGSNVLSINSGGPEEWRRAIECRKLLLRAGADPTFAVDEANFLDLTNAHGEAESIQLAWNPEITAPFANISTYRDENGLSPFLALCHSYSYTKEHFRHFLRIGANLQDRDDQGRTCLHICFEGLHEFDTGLREFEAIEYLVQKGADPYAVDNFGRSVCDTAYTTNRRRTIKCSYAGDLWDAILHRCGYDIPQFRSGYRRRARRSDLATGEEVYESGSELDTEEDEEGHYSRRCQNCSQVHEDEEKSESDMGEDMRTGDVESYWEETGTLPGFGELMQGVQSENWQVSPDLQQSTVGTPRSLSMDLENPWL